MTTGRCDNNIRRQFCFLALFCLFALYDGKGLASDISAKDLLKECCTTHSYGGKDPRMLSLRSPIGIQILSFDVANRMDPAPPYIQSVVDTFQSLTKKTIYLNRSNEWMKRASTGVYIVLLPEHRSDLTETDLFSLRGRFGAFENVITNPQGGKGIDGILNVMYSSDKNVIYTYRTNSGSSAEDVFAVVRPNSQANTPNSVKRAVLESLGYNTDNIRIGGTIFDGSEHANLTSKDIEATEHLNRK